MTGQVRAAVFHRDGVEALASQPGEEVAGFAGRVKDEVELRHGAVAVVDVTGAGAAVLDWLREHGCRAEGVNRATPPGVTVRVTGGAVMGGKDIDLLVDRIGRRIADGMRRTRLAGWGATCPARSGSCRR